MSDSDPGGGSGELTRGCRTRTREAGAGSRHAVAGLGPVRREAYTRWPVKGTDSFVGVRTPTRLARDKWPVKGTASFVGVGTPTTQAWGQEARPGHQATVSTRPRRRTEGIFLIFLPIPLAYFFHSSGIVIVIVVVSWVTGCARSSLKN